MRWGCGQLPPFTPRGKPSADQVGQIARAMRENGSRDWFTLACVAWAEIADLTTPTQSRLKMAAASAQMVPAQGRCRCTCENAAGGLDGNPAAPFSRFTALTLGREAQMEAQADAAGKGCLV